MYNHINGTHISQGTFNIYDGAAVDSKTDKTIIMRAYKYDGRLHYEQPLTLNEKSENHLVLEGAKGRELIHHTRGKTFRFNESTLEFFFTDRWYTAALIFDDNGNVIYVYCNIALPCRISDETVEFTDLDVDVVVKDGRIEVIDIDEFEEHKIKYKYGKDLEKKVFEAVETVIEDITFGNYPFNRDILK